MLPGFLFGRLLLPKHKSNLRLVRGPNGCTSGFSGAGERVSPWIHLYKSKDPLGTHEVYL